MTAPPIQLPEPSQAALRAARALQRRAQRAETGMFLVEGRQAVREALAAPGVVEEVYFRWDAVIAVNLSAVFHGIHHALPGMKRRGWGRIVNIASVHGHVASVNKSAYVAAKHGVVGLTKTVALELATFKITCNCISPGYVWTPLVEKQIPDTMKARNMTKDQVIKDVLLEAQPTKEFVTAEQVGALALFLCGDDAAQITGANLSIDGGWTAE